MIKSRKPGRPPKPGGRQPPGMHVSVPRDVAAQLSQIAEREGLFRGPAPSLAGAIRWLVERDPNAVSDTTPTTK